MHANVMRNIAAIRRMLVALVCGAGASLGAIAQCAWGGNGIGGRLMAGAPVAWPHDGPGTEPLSQDAHGEGAAIGEQGVISPGNWAVDGHVTEPWSQDAHGEEAGGVAAMVV